MDVIISILAAIAIITTLISTFTTMKLINVRRQVNHIISNHNDMIYILEEENQLLQKRLLVIPNELIASIDKAIDNSSNMNTEELKAVIKSMNKLYDNHKSDIKNNS